jgi:pilus assembly protein CpaF
MNANALTIRERLGNAYTDSATPFQMPRPIGIENQSYRELKLRIHQTLLERVDLEGMQRLSQEQLAGRRRRRHQRCRT